MIGVTYKMTIKRGGIIGKCQWYRTEPVREREDKELTRAADFPPSWQFPKTIRFGDANWRGSPLKNEGVGGVFVWGLGKSSPVGLDKVQGFYSASRILCRSTLFTIVKYSVLYFTWKSTEKQ